MHSVWDSMMFEQRVKRDYRGSNDVYTQFIVKQIGTIWRAEASEWLSCPLPGNGYLSMQQSQDIFTIAETGSKLYTF
jgi:hypothetical protein